MHKHQGNRAPKQKGQPEGSAPCNATLDTDLRGELFKLPSIIQIGLEPLRLLATAQMIDVRWIGRVNVFGTSRRLCIGLTCSPNLMTIEAQFTCLCLNASFELWTLCLLQFLNR